MSELDDVYMVNEKIYIGAYWPRINFKKLKKLGITSIINLMEDNLYDPRPEGFNYLHEGFPDNTYVSYEKLKKILSFMDVQLKKGKILVHCSMGISRSAGIIIAWLLKENPDWSWKKAFEYVNNSRKIYPAVELRQAILDYLESIDGYRRKVKM